MKYKLLILALLLVVSSFVSANGLQVMSGNVSLNKTNGQDYEFNITIRNEEAFTFHNVTSTNDIISFDSFSLGSGQSKNVLVTTSNNNNFDGSVIIRGDYFAELGQQNITEKINISVEGFDICNLDLIVGDKIVWNNTLFSEIKLKNVNTGEDFATLPGQTIYEEHFLNAQEFDYRAYRSGIPFSRVCHLNIQPTTGYVHSQSLDAKLNLKIDIVYEPTTILMNFLEENYSLSYNEKREDIFSIRNTGNRVAKDIRLSGEWVNFDDNNFDLNPGESKNIGYSIEPFITTTNETNKTKNIIISAEGNFPKAEKMINVFVSYYDIDGVLNGSTIDAEAIKQLLKVGCLQYPDACPVRLINASDIPRNVTFNVNEDTYLEGELQDTIFQEQMLGGINTLNQRVDIIEKNSEGDINKTLNTDEKVDNLGSDIETLAILVYIIIGVALFLILGFLVYTAYQKNIFSFKLSKEGRAIEGW